MAEAMAPEKLRALDACIERLLAGRDWRGALPDDQSRAEIVALMEVAEWLVESAGRTPRPPEHVRRRVWDRVTRLLGRYTAALGGGSLLRAMTETSVGGVRRNLSLGGGLGGDTNVGGHIPPGTALPGWRAVPIATVEHKHSQRG
ncbi:MAG: hypothetical protein Kow0010_00780 [Dehalococcoidia bacterium]